MVRKVHKYADGGKIVEKKEKPKASPGFFGAVKDAIKSTSKAAAPKSVTQRKSRIDEAIEEAGG